MLQASLSQLEQLVNDLLERNRQLTEAHQQVAAELSRAREENETLQLGLMEQEELQGAAAARIQALVDRATAVSA